MRHAGNGIDESTAYAKHDNYLTGRPPIHGMVLVRGGGWRGQQGRRDVLCRVKPGAAGRTIVPCRKAVVGDIKRTGGSTKNRTFQHDG